MRNLRRFWLLPVGIIIGIVLGVGGGTLLRRATDTTKKPGLPLQGIVLPEGFKADVYAQPAGAELPSLVAFDPDGKLYLMTVSGKIFRLEDNNGDHQPEVINQIFDNANQLLTQSVGMAFRDGKMYISDSGRISTFEDSDGDGKLDKLTPIVEGLPSLQFPDHSNNGIVFGPDGKLYVGIGATSDHGPLKDPLEASVVRMNPDGSEMEVFATGFRNPYDLDFSPEGALFTADNNPSHMDAGLPYLPPEELNYVQAGRDYGFPRVYGNPPANDNSAAPVTEFYASVGSAGLAYYSGDAFPPEWRNGVYVAQWGTGANIALDRGITNGQALVFVPLRPNADGIYRSDFKSFLYFDTESRLRPVDVTVGPDGALYMVEFTTSTIYRISYTGDTTTAVPPTITPSPEPIPTFAAELIEDGGELFLKGANGAPACVTCHLAGGKVGLGPGLEGLHEIAGSRVAGTNAVEYVRDSIITPNAYIVPGYNANYMYQNYATSLSSEQIDALVAYVLSLKKS